MDELPPERAEAVVNKFLEGYALENTIDENTIKYMSEFRRFANLFGYARVLQASHEKWDNEPEWLVKLRGKLDNLLSKRSSMFGREIGRQD